MANTKQNKTGHGRSNESRNELGQFSSKKGASSSSSHTSSSRSNKNSNKGRGSSSRSSKNEE